MDLLLISENDDFMVPVFEVATFPSGNTSGSVCLSLLIILDDRMEDPEVFMVVIKSNDQAVRISDDTAMITIINRIPGK